jgi:hypothetical protein
VWEVVLLMEKVGPEPVDRVVALTFPTTSTLEVDVYPVATPIPTLPEASITNAEVSGVLESSTKSEFPVPFCVTRRAGVEFVVSMICGDEKVFVRFWTATRR